MTPREIAEQIASRSCKCSNPPKYLWTPHYGDCPVRWAEEGASAAVPRWVPVEGRLPDEDVEVLWSVIDGGIFIGRLFKSQSGQTYAGQRDTNIQYPIDECNYWMSFPDRPDM